MPYPMRTVAAVTALGLAGAAFWAAGSGGSESDPDPGTVSLGRTASVALTTDHDCSDLLAYYKREATRVVGPYGLGGGPMYRTADGATAMAADGRAVAPNAAGGQEKAAASDVGGSKLAPDTATNVQVAGVDESDVVKTDGDLMVAVVNGEVRITRLAGAQTKTLASWRPTEGTAQSLLLDGTMAVVIGDRQNLSAWGAAKRPAPDSSVYSSAVTDLTVLDLSDPAKPRPVRRLELSGTRAGAARLVDGELRLAVTADPTGIEWEHPDYPPMLQDPRKSQADLEKSEKRATAANKKLIAKSVISNWIPEAVVAPLDPRGGVLDAPVIRRPLLDCSQIAVPGSFSGLATLALVSVDLRVDAPMTSWRSAGVIAAGSTVYATADRVWLATSRWDDVSTVAASVADISRFRPSAANTQIHRFDTPSRAQPKYVASGEIAGSLLSQFSMDEQDGLLRVASTTDGAGLPMPVEEEQEEGPAEGQEQAQGETAVKPSAQPKLSEGRVTVLTTDGKRLTQAGLVTGLGVGERIRGIRFIGDVGYVVTYRQTDPLYTVDLSDPTQPRVRGELAVLGYSAYLHPAGAGRLLGLGQDGTKSGRTTGLQLSLFDVADLDAPRRLDTEKLADAWSDAENDHHAFTMAGDLVLIPYNSWTSASTPEPAGRVAPDGGYREVFDAGVIAVRVGPDGIGAPTTLRPVADGPLTVESGQMSATVQRATEATPLRTVVHDGTIYTLTPSGVAAHGGAGFDRLTFADF